MKKNTKGFTLIELLVTMIILGIVAAIALPGVKSIYETNNRKKITNYINDLKQSAKLYTDSHADDMFGYETSGCFDISFTELKAKNLAKDIGVNDYTCDSSNTFIRVEKANNSYTYTYKIHCTNKTTGKLVKDDNDLKQPSKVCSGAVTGINPPAISLTPREGYIPATGIVVSIEDANGLAENQKVSYAWKNITTGVTSTYTEIEFPNKRFATKATKTIPAPATGKYQLIIKPVKVVDTNQNKTTANYVSDTLEKTA